MNLYFQFLTQEKSANAVEVIQLPTLLWPGQSLGGKAKVSAEGVISHSTFARIEALSANKSKKQFRQLEVIYNAPKTLQLGTCAAQVVSLNGVFTTSPTCELWLPCRKWSMAVDGTVGNRWTMAKVEEKVIKHYAVEQKPCIFEMVLQINTPSSQECVLDECAHWLASGLSGTFAGLELFGCCDAGGPGFAVRIEAGDLMADHIRIMGNTWPVDYAALGHCFEALHPLMFGSKQLCAKISKALGKDAKILASSYIKDFAVVRLKSKCDMIKATAKAVASGAVLRKH